ncbi:hypothetical protein J7394_00080 [Ruegeria sp. R13_0]|uniref:hypothetical protein n=1 Tax=Ruegeria sp. R13_0 TaxID=2821099 RepID=UPI001ADAB909|nr:hypothetical protein [Ruegeria sp. R13_0]MBO9432581.1 hypothetical protein [Ruegeria sp. R13_0]
MRRFFIWTCFAATFVALQFPFPASIVVAEETVVWSDNIKGWHIAVDRTTGDGCFMVTAYEGGTYLRGQILPSEQAFALMIGNTDWRSIESGKLYDLTATFGSRTPWKGEAHGFWIGESPFLSLQVPFESGQAAEFIDEFMRLSVVDIGYEGKSIATLKLSGTYAAMLEVMECQRQMFESIPEIDPFASSGNDKDPFD